MRALAQAETGRGAVKSVGVDRAGMIVSLGCGLHCALTPVVAGFAASAGFGWVFTESTEMWLLGGAVALGGLGLGLGYWLHHGRMRCFVWFLIGAALLLLAKIGPIGEGLEPWAVGAGAIAIATAHAVNIHLCRRCASCKPEVEAV